MRVVEEKERGRPNGRGREGSLIRSIEMSKSPGNPRVRAGKLHGMHRKKAVQSRSTTVYLPPKCGNIFNSIAELTTVAKAHTRMRLRSHWSNRWFSVQESEPCPGSALIVEGGIDRRPAVRKPDAIR